MQRTRSVICETYEDKGLSRIEEFAEEDIKELSLPFKEAQEKKWERVKKYVDIIVEEYGLEEFLKREGCYFEDIVRRIRSFDNFPPKRITKYFSSELKMAIIYNQKSKYAWPLRHFKPDNILYTCNLIIR